jgi:hypothetical protein
MHDGDADVLLGGAAVLGDLVHLAQCGQKVLQVFLPGVLAMNA